MGERHITVSNNNFIYIALVSSVTITFHTVMSFFTPLVIWAVFLSFSKLNYFTRKEERSAYKNRFVRSYEVKKEDLSVKKTIL